MNALYTTKVTAIGGRSGTVNSEDGILNLNLALPKGLGGKGGATNPEQLFAAGYAACFENAILHVARNQKVALKDEDVVVVATVGIGANASGGFALSVALDTSISGLDPKTAETIVQAAHETCPYSNAVKGNIDVKITVTAK